MFGDPGRKVGRAMVACGLLVGFVCLSHFVLIVGAALGEFGTLRGHGSIRVELPAGVSMGHPPREESIPMETYIPLMVFVIWTQALLVIAGTRLLRADRPG